MIIYNVTCHVSPAVHEDWREFMKTHIPEVLGTGLFTGAKFTKVLVDDPDGAITYSIQYRAISREALDEYYKSHAEKLREAGLKRFGENVLAFRTELEEIDNFSVNFNS